MNQIHLIYPKPDQLTLFTTLSSFTAPRIAQNIGYGYSSTISEDVPGIAIVQIWNILQEDIEKYGTDLDRHIMGKALEKEGYDFIKSMLWDDRECLACKIRDTIRFVMHHVFNTDTVEIVHSGFVESPDHCRSSTPRIIDDLLHEHFEIVSEEMVAHNEENHTVIKIKKEDTST